MVDSNKGRSQREKICLPLPKENFRTSKIGIVNTMFQHQNPEGVAQKQLRASGVAASPWVGFHFR